MNATSKPVYGTTCYTRRAPMKTNIEDVPERVPNEFTLVAVVSFSNCSRAVRLRRNPGGLIHQVIGSIATYLLFSTTSACRLLQYTRH